MNKALETARLAWEHAKATLAAEKREAVSKRDWYDELATKYAPQTRTETQQSDIDMALWEYQSQETRVKEARAIAETYRRRYHQVRRYVHSERLAAHYVKGY